jgi:hypothetical protein
VVALELVIYAVVGLLLLLLVWPVPRSARKLLVNWRVAEPTADQVGEALGYLRRRRVWYPLFFLGTPVVLGWFGTANGGYGSFLITVLAALLIAELLALRPSRASVRTADLLPRGLYDLVPRWGVVLYLALGVATAGFAVAGLIGQQRTWRMGNDGGWEHADAFGPEPWLIVFATIVCLLAVGQR